MRDLWRWSSDPVGLLDDRKRETGPFILRLWRPVIVGHRPQWNQRVLSDLDAFRSTGSLSRLTPYLNGGVVQTDAPAHRPQRRVLNQHFQAKVLPSLGSVRVPAGVFDTTPWAYAAVRHMLNAAFFGGRFDPLLLQRFLRPLTYRFPGPFLPRPALFARMNRAIALQLRDAAPHTLAGALSGVPNPVEEIRVSLAAGFDTTAHTLAWAAWHLAAQPEWADPASLPSFLQEVLRLYPAGWIGSRVAQHDVTVDGFEVRQGTMVCYSPYLTHRDPRWWPAPDQFRPERFADRPAPWTYLPFSFGPRTCLGMHLAQHMLTAALTALAEGRIRREGTEIAEMRAGITIAPAGSLLIRRTVNAAKPVRTALGGSK